jgi:hypothetical protein
MQNSSKAVAKISDSWDTAGDEVSPVRGPNIKFDGGAYFTGKEKTPLEDDRKFVVIARAEGWQLLKKECQPEWVMRKDGEPKPEQPFVEEETWPIGLDGKPQHPWRYTLFVYLLDAATGETFTFSSNSAGGRIGVNELTSQIKYMRNMKPGAVPIVALESRNFPTKFGKKQRPFFKIEGWKIRDDNNSGDQRLLTAANSDSKVNDLNDEITW